MGILKTLKGINTGFLANQFGGMTQDGDDWITMNCSQLVENGINKGYFFEG